MRSINQKQLQDPNVIRKVQRLIDITKAIRLILKIFNHLRNDDEKAKIIGCLGNILDRQYEVAEEILKSKLITLCKLLLHYKYCSINLVFKYFILFKSTNLTNLLFCSVSKRF
jgi:hypothetical protein